MCFKKEDALKHLLQTKGYRNGRHWNGDKILQERSPWKGLYRQKTFQRREVLCLVFETFEGSTLAEKVFEISSLEERFHIKGKTLDAEGFYGSELMRNVF